MKDLVIIGGGVAGLTAGMYAKRSGLDVVLFESMFPGGQVSTTYSVENYPGFDEPIDGPDFALKMESHARKFGLDILYDEVIDLELNGEVKTAITRKGKYDSKTLIIATGAKPKTLGLMKEDKFRGKGVSYCATCDGALYRDKTTVVVGGGDTAAEDVILLAEYAKHVYLIHRRGQLRASKILQDRVLKNPKIEILWDTVVEDIFGENQVKGVLVNNLKTGTKLEIDADGIFVAIGIQPNDSLIKGKLTLTEGGFAISDENMNSNIPGVFLAGDIRQKPLRQLVTAAADGAVAAISAQRYIIQKQS